MKKIISLVILALLVGCTKPGDKTGYGALGGAALGAGLGAIVGAPTGDAGRGVAIGAGIGALSGALAGNALDAQEEQTELTQERLAYQRGQIEENARLIRELRGAGADVRESKRGVVINLPDVLFEFNRADLTAEARHTVAEIGDILKNTVGREIAVEGHTDSIGSVQYNKRLSMDRADTVARALAHEGVPGGSIRAYGYGEGAPIATNNTDAGRARNRRVEVIIENDRR
ncbi:OmpA family protein [bacterium]|nr:OmpA family protein [bacterium]